MRKLAIKAATRVIKDAFLAKGTKVTHTEALDLIAKLQGFEAWSHLSQVAGQLDSSKSVPTVRAPKLISLADILKDYFRQWGECPCYPRSDWQYEVLNNDTNQSYWEFVQGSAFSADGDEFDSRGQAAAVRDGYKVPKPVVVTLPTGQTSTWSIQPNLTTRDGELNEYNDEYKPALAVLSLAPSLLKDLRASMYNDLSFIAFKDECFGILYEVEYASAESESSFTDGQKFSPHDEVVSRLTQGLQLLETAYPGVQFCVPDKTEICRDRPAVWAFVPMDLPFADSEKAALEEVLLSL